MLASALKSLCEAGSPQGHSGIRPPIPTIFKVTAIEKRVAEHTAPSLVQTCVESIPWLSAAALQTRVDQDRCSVVEAISPSFCIPGQPLLRLVLFGRHQEPFSRFFVILSALGLFSCLHLFVLSFQIPHLGKHVSCGSLRY